jgi:hypothetical protein
MNKNEDSEDMIYRVVAHNHLDPFVDAVNNALDEGWECLGGISTIVDSEGCVHFYQAIKKLFDPDDIKI